MKYFVSLFLVVATPLVVACEVEDIVVVTRDAGVDTGTGGCQEDSDCPSGEFCDKHGCGATSGTCTPELSTCSPAQDPVCGCDGVTYYNDCFRKRTEPHVPLNHHEECGPSGRPCDVAGECGSQASCGLLLAPNSHACAKAVGRCWVLPTTCDESEGGDRFSECVPEGIPAKPCESLCLTIQSERPHVREFKCPK